MSIPLEKVEDENYDNNEEFENFGIENSNFQENDMDSFESNDYYDDSENTSSGVSFDELSDTVDALYNNNFTKNEEEKIVSVLDTINGTELFEFITINNTVYENAKLLMSSFNREEQESDNFNINQFL